MSKRIKEDNQNTVKTAVAMLDNSALIAIPTETVYGLLAKYNDREAIERIYKLKNRDDSKPLTILVANLKQAMKYGIFNNLAKKLAETFWPGPLTLIIPTIYDQAQWIGIRVAQNNFIEKVLIMLDEPVVATSLNSSGMKDVVIYEEISDFFLENIDAVFDIYENKPFGISSTIVKIIDEDYQVIRRGVIKEEEISKILLN